MYYKEMKIRLSVWSTQLSVIVNFNQCDPSFIFLFCYQLNLLLSLTKPLGWRGGAHELCNDQRWMQTCLSPFRTKGSNMNYGRNFTFPTLAHLPICAQPHIIHIQAWHTSSTKLNDVLKEYGYSLDSTRDPFH